MHGYLHHHSQSSTIFEWIPLFILIIIAIVYVLATIRLQSKNGSWNPWRTVSFISGIALLFVAMLPSLVQWAHHDLRGHMVQHLLIGMFAPIGLVLGAPVTLALRILPVKASRKITTILGSRIFHFFSHPVTTLLLNVGGMYVLYLTPLYNASFTKPYLHHLMHVHFLAAGYLFTWSMIGVDPAPRRPTLRMRVLILFMGIASHAFLSKFMYAYLFPLNSPHSDEQIREAAKLMYYWGDLSELLLAIALFAIWYQKRGRSNYDLSPLIT